MFVHDRVSPNGRSSAQIVLPDGINVEDLKYKQQLTILVDGEEKNAVVDLIVAAFWGGTSKAFAVYDRDHELYHVMIKLVWCEPDGDWNESRDVREATEEEFLAWRNEFDGDNPPTPMPLD